MSRHALVARREDNMSGNDILQNIIDSSPLIVDFLFIVIAVYLYFKWMNKETREVKNLPIIIGILILATLVSGVVSNFANPYGQPPSLANFGLWTLFWACLNIMILMTLLASKNVPG